MDPRVKILGDFIQEHLVKIRDVLPDSYEITFYARCPSMPDADVMMTNDDIEKVVAGIRALAHKRTAARH